MNGRHERFRELCAAWVLGALDGEEVAEFRELLAGADAEMRRIHEELDRAAQHLALSAPPQEPPLALKQRILAALSAEPAREDLATRLATRLRLHRPRFALAVAAALTAAVVGLGLLTASLQRTLRGRDQRITELQDAVAYREQLLAIVGAREVTVVTLNGLDSSPEGYGRLVWDTRSQVALLKVGNLPPAAEDQVYQVWIYPKEGEPTSPGVLRAAAQAPESFFRIEGFTNLDAAQMRGILITRESAPGAARPSDDWYLGVRFSS